MTVILRLRFDGRDAVDHRLDMAKFGRSLVGLDHIISKGLFSLAEGRFPAPREQMPIRVWAEVPQPHCVDYNVVVGAADSALPFILAVLNDHISDVAWQLMSFMLSKLGGKSTESDRQLDILSDLMKGVLLDRASERAHVEHIVSMLVPSARALVAPIGPSCDTLQLTGSSGQSFQVDVPMADAVRSRESLEVGDLAEFHVYLDGIISHNNTLKLGVQGEEGFVTAEVRDPSFANDSNIYLNSYRKHLFVMAKPTYREGKLYRLYVMDARAA
ncbi:MAG TPA: hypothetical protein VH353_16170 [Caulobacteraceae bacterium]|jgi:hypothetical protein|nr:hypothetical protein [Caulobacteraceae bacterium]